MKVTYYGHSCFGFQICGKHILTDPFISNNPLAKHIDVNQVPADYILLTHAHQDHVDDVELIAKRTNATIVSNFEIVNYYKAKGLEGSALNHGGTFEIPQFSAKYVRAVHTSSFADGTYGGNPGGFILSGQGISIYIAGDTALTMDMKLIPLQHKLLTAILPIGGTFTMDVDDAIFASDLIECDTIIGCHYDTFPPIEIDKDIAKNKFLAQDKELVLMEIGQTIEI